METMSRDSDPQPTVFIVDDDPDIRFAMRALMDSNAILEAVERKIGPLK